MRARVQDVATTRAGEMYRSGAIQVRDRGDGYSDKRTGDGDAVAGAVSRAADEARGGGGGGPACVGGGVSCFTPPPRPPPRRKVSIGMCS